jgi:hypothetical protein
MASGNIGRNLLHNPLFNVAQRGAGPWTVSGYTADRWNSTFVGGTQSFAINVFTDGSRAVLGDEAATFSLTNAFAGAAAVGSYNLLSQRIEDIRRLAGKTVTLSFWAAAAAGTPRLGVSLDQYFGTGGSPSPLVGGTGVAVTLNTTWTRYSATFTLPSIAGKTLGTANDNFTGLNFWYSAEATFATRSGNIGVQTGTVFLWGVQLEIGSQATPLEKPDPRYDLSNCQRFYQAGGNARVTAYQTAGNGAAITQSLPVSMRATPTIATSNFTASNISSASLTALDPSTIQIFTGTFTATGTGYVQMNYTAAADL